MHLKKRISYIHGSSFIVIAFPAKVALWSTDE